MENHLDWDTKHALNAPVDLSFNIFLVASYTYINNKVLCAMCSIFRTSYYNLIQTSTKYYQLGVSNKQATEYSFIMSPGGRKWLCCFVPELRTSFSLFFYLNTASNVGGPN